MLKSVVTERIDRACHKGWTIYEYKKKHTCRLAQARPGYFYLAAENPLTKEMCDQVALRSQFMKNLQL